MTDRTHVDREGMIHSEGVPPTRILSWNPPVLLLEREGELRRVFVSAADQGGWFGLDGKSWPLPSATGATSSGGGGEIASSGDLTAPMPGRVLEVLVAAGEGVTAGQRLLVLEAMKMETPVRAPHDGTVKAVHVKSDDAVDPGQLLVEIEAAEGESTEKEGA